MRGIEINEPPQMIEALGGKQVHSFLLRVRQPLPSPSQGECVHMEGAMRFKERPPQPPVRRIAFILRPNDFWFSGGIARRRAWWSTADVDQVTRPALRTLCSPHCLPDWEVEIAFAPFRVGLGVGSGEGQRPTPGSATRVAEQAF
jgi:hypothetical protein